MFDIATSQTLRGACYLKGSRSALTTGAAGSRKSTYMKLAELSSEKSRLRKESLIWERRLERIHTRLNEIEEQTSYLLRRQEA
ncbi:MAG: hypothetical protein HYU64_21070 [Armatimonadetes bacterium]|nr:hypothetical protein [Armatimonadota bacterium]